jgi:hypothetical protein
LTHSLHREGNISSLKNDFVILITPAIGLNDKESAVKLKKCFKILLEIGVENIGDVEHGSIMSGLNPDFFESYLEDGKRIRAVISEKNQLKKILDRLKREDTGLSVTVSGLTDDIFKVSNKVGLKPHTINMSLGVWGKRDLLPSKEILQITTMCGHHMISRNLVQDSISSIKLGVISPEAATKRIGKLCVCGIFNPKRCNQLFNTCAKHNDKK